ncbi:terminase [Hypericibacter terrae]|uniref:Terminase n=1 Tax=Hypericibacter terrae TaxID=2602015 RepID=A0A5J6MLR7_9PROT|nr:terminase TerL endonuclease subunit [Hypericibacter terrae]QEX18508.1 terminase [Hypericibacter terrae]
MAARPKAASRRARALRSASSLTPEPTGSTEEAPPPSQPDEPDPPAPNGAPAGCWFDRKAADAACDFFPRYLRHTEGEWAGQPFTLAAWQRRIVRTIFGWKKADGTRLIRVVYIEIPRKNGKTEFAAGLALLLLLGDGEFGGQGYAMAADKDQAKIVFNKASVMVQFSDLLMQHCEAFKTSVYCAQLMASFKPLSRMPGTKQGFSPSFAIGDEIHVWPTGELADVVHKGTAARQQPLEVYLTTAGIKGVGYGWELHDRALKILEGTLVDPTFLPVIFAANDNDDWLSDETVAKVNPSIGISPKWDYIRAERAKAQESPRLENEFKRYHLNIWTEQVTRWIPIEAWDACAGEIAWQDLPAAMKGRRCFAAVDLSAKVDLSARVLAFPPETIGGLWHLVPRLYLPKQRVENAEKRDRLPYREWERMGALVLTPGDVIDYGYIEQQLMADAAEFQLVETGFDPWNAMQFAVRMQGEGLVMKEFRQGYGSMSEPSKQFEAEILAGRLRHGGHPVLREMVKAVSVATDPAGNIKPDKSAATLRIDGVVASIMGMGLAMVAPPAEPDINDVIMARGGLAA